MASSSNTALNRRSRWRKVSASSLLAFVAVALIFDRVGSRAFSCQLSEPSRTVAPEETSAKGFVASRSSPVLHASTSRQSSESSASNWVFQLLASLGAVAMLLGSPQPSMAEDDASAKASTNVPDVVQLYFGQGCFWHTQHDLALLEQKALGRAGNDITARTGYAGGKKVGKLGQVCYHNRASAPDYGEYGHTEVAAVSVPTGKVKEFSKFFFDSAAKNLPYGRPDPQDRGDEYRSALGIPGGVDSPLFADIKAANAGRLQLAVGQGNDPDTLDTKFVWVYDSDKYPFRQAEVYHQFHDDMKDMYSKQYHEAKDVLVKSGRLASVKGCPEPVEDMLMTEEVDFLKGEDTFSFSFFGDLVASFAPKVSPDSFAAAAPKGK